MIKTHITWLIDQVPATTELTAKLVEMETQEKTDGIRTIISQGDGQITIERTWIDVDAANEWINFITSTFTPVSAVIVE
jgi:hypothetical protein